MGSSEKGYLQVCWREVTLSVHSQEGESLDKGRGKQWGGQEIPSKGMKEAAA